LRIPSDADWVKGDPIDATDPLGIRVVGSMKAWQHILKGHPEFAATGMLEAVSQAITTPIVISDDREPGRRRAYYGAAPWPYRETDRVRACALADRKSRWYLTTAHIATAVASGEVILWKRP
jgi:hypothetical protein